MLKHKLKVCHQFSSFKIGACFEFSEGRGDYSHQEECYIL